MQGCCRVLAHTDARNPAADVGSVQGEILRGCFLDQLGLHATVSSWWVDRWGNVQCAPDLTVLAREGQMAPRSSRSF